MEKINKIKNKHGLSSHKLYKTWTNMKDRCLNQNHKDFHNYGGRGITVCNEWKNDFKAFYDWSISNEYKGGLDIDRINNNGNYEPHNCRFVTRVINSMNRRVYGKVKYRGVTIRKYNGKYQATVRHNSKLNHIGYFETAIEAAKAYDKYVVENKLSNQLNFLKK